MTDKLAPVEIREKAADLFLKHSFQKRSGQLMEDITIEDVKNLEECEECLLWYPKLEVKRDPIGRKVCDKCLIDISDRLKV